MQLSIITVNYNDKAGLEKTLASIQAQTLQPAQSLVIDGGSADGSAEVIARFGHLLSYRISEPDRGVYEAMNKGIRAATSEYVLFLNSGDVLAHPNVLQEVAAQFPAKDLVYGNLLLDKGRGAPEEKTYPSQLTFQHFFTNDESLPHPATFIKRSLFTTVGFYNESFKIVSDWEFWLKALFLHGASYQHIPVAVSVFDMGGMSSSPQNGARIAAEKREVYMRHFPHLVEDYKGLLMLRQQSKAHKLLLLAKSKLKLKR
jgi:glycosyltransferase involved in cell wall biosynthesis